MEEPHLEAGALFTRRAIHFQNTNNQAAQVGGMNNKRRNLYKLPKTVKKQNKRKQRKLIIKIPQRGLKFTISCLAVWTSKMVATFKHSGNTDNFTLKQLPRSPTHSKPFIAYYENDDLGQLPEIYILFKLKLTSEVLVHSNNSLTFTTNIINI